MSKSLQAFQGPFAAPAGSPMRRAAASILRQSSRMLARMARRVHETRMQSRARRAPELEFYVEAGAPEGALYVDGSYFGHVPGVTRL